MEEFTVIFGATNEPVGENDYFFNNFTLDRAVPSADGSFFPENYSNYKKAIPVLCSKSLGIGDNVLIDSGVGVPAIIGKIVSIDWPNELTTINILSEIEIDYQTLQTGETIDTIEASTNICFFPIIELQHQNPLMTIVNHQKLGRDEIDFQTLCPKCQMVFREPGNCETYGEQCEKNNRKQLALIK